MKMNEGVGRERGGGGGERERERERESIIVHTFHSRTYEEVTSNKFSYDTFRFPLCLDKVFAPNIFLQRTLETLQLLFVSARRDSAQTCPTVCMVVNVSSSARRRLPSFVQEQQAFEDGVRAYCQPGRVEFVWIDVAKREEVSQRLYPSLISLWDQCGVLIERQRAELRQTLAEFKKAAGILAHLVDVSQEGYSSGVVMRLMARRNTPPGCNTPSRCNTPFMSCRELIEQLHIADRVEWPVLLSQLSDTGDIVILQRAATGQLG